MPLSFKEFNSLYQSGKSTDDIIREENAGLIVPGQSQQANRPFSFKEFQKERESGKSLEEITAATASNWRDTYTPKQRATAAASPVSESKPTNPGGIAGVLAILDQVKQTNSQKAAQSGAGEVLHSAQNDAGGTQNPGGEAQSGAGERPAAGSGRGGRPAGYEAMSEAERRQAEKAELKETRDRLQKGLEDLQHEKAARTQIWDANGYVGEDKELAAQYDEKINRILENLKNTKQQIKERQEPVNYAEVIGKGVATGFSRAGLDFTAGLNWLLGEKSLPWEALNEAATLFGMPFWGEDPLKGKNPITKLYEHGKQEVEEWENATAAAAYGNDAAEKVARHSQSISQSAPFIVLNLMSMGAGSAAAGTTEALEYTAALNSSSGLQAISTMANQGIRTLAANPSAQYSFASTFGSSYEDALKDGADETEASLYAVLNGCFNAMIEVGGADEGLGGIQKLPSEVREALSSGDRALVLDYVKSIVEEIGEEELQGIMERGLKSLYQDVELGSTENPDAVFNPSVMLETAKDTAIDTAIMSGGQTAIQVASNRAAARGAEREAKRAADSAQNAQDGAGDISAPPSTQNADTAQSERLNRAINEGAEGQTEAERGYARLQELIPGLQKPNAETGEQVSAAPSEANNATPAEGTEAQTKTAPEGAEESTVINTDPAEHTPQQQRTIAEYTAAVDEGIKQFVNKVRQLENQRYRNSIRHSISEVAPRAAAEVNRLTGVNAEGFENILTGSAVDHIDRRHGERGKADHSMADVNDLARIQYVLDNFDGAYLLTNQDGSPSVSDVWKNSDGTPAQRIVFYKDIDSTYYAVEATPDSNARVLAVESAFIGSDKNKSSTGTVLNMANTAPQVTSETPQRASATPSGESHSPGTAAESDASSHGNAYAPSVEESTSAPTIAPDAEEVNGERVERESESLREDNSGGPLSAPPTGGESEDTYAASDRKRSRTESNTLSGVAEKLGGEQEKLYYMPITERQTLNEAVNRVTADGFGEMQSLMDKPQWTAADVDTGMTLYGKLMADAVRTGDYSAARSWAKVVQSRGTGSAQALQAFSKWTRSGTAQAFKAGERLSELTDGKNGNRRNLTKEDAARISNDIYEFGSTYDGIEAGDLGGIRELIKRQSDYRGTGTFAESNYVKLLEQETDFDYLKEYALRQMMNIADDYTVQPDLGKTLKTWQVNAQLTRLGTFFRNIGGNVLFGAQDTLTQDGLGVALDWMASKATGRRTVGVDKSWFSSRARQAMTDSMRRSVLEVAGDVNMSGSMSRYGTSANRTFKMNGNGVERFLSRWEQLLGYSLNTSDQASRGSIEGAISESLGGFGRSAEEIAEIAENTADYRLFQNKDTAYKLSKGVHDVMNVVGVGGEVNGVTRNGGFGLGDLVNPYPGVPANLAVKALEYSPANIVKGGIELAEVLKSVKTNEWSAVKQNRAVMDIARGMAGTPIIALLATAFKTGVVKNADDEDDYDVSAQNAAEGKSGVQINLDAWLRAMKGGSAEWKDGDELLSIGWLEPMNAFMAISSMIAEEQPDDVSVSAMIGTYAKDYFSGTLQSVLEMPVMANIANMVDSYKYSTGENGVEKLGDAAISLTGDAVTGMIPAPVSQLARAMDTSYRDTGGNSKTEQVVNSILSAIPGLRQTLPVKQDNYGNPKEYTSNPVLRYLNSFVLPGAVNELRQTETSAAVEKLYESTGDAGVYPDRKAPNSIKYDGETTKLSAEEKREYHSTYGQIVEENTNRLLVSGDFDGLSDEEKAGLIDKIKSYASDRAKKEIVELLGLTYKSTSWDKTAAVVESGVPLVDYLVGKQRADANGNGSLSQEEAYSWLTDADFSEEQKAVIWANVTSGSTDWETYKGKQK